MAKRKATASGFGTPEVLSERILAFIQESAAALESGTITEKEFGKRITNAMRQAGSLPEFARRKLRLDAQSARLSAKDTATLRTSRPPRVATAPLDLASFNAGGQDPAQRRLTTLLSPEPTGRPFAGGNAPSPAPPSQPAFIRKALGGVQLPNVAEPRLAAAIESGDRPGAKSLVKGQQKIGGFKQLAAGGVGGTLGLLILKSLFAGKQNDGIDPAVQLQLAQQLGGGGQQPGVNTSQTLSQVGKLLSIIKSIQGLGAIAGPASQEPRLI